MKIAIVRGGFDGIRAQMRAWHAEDEVERRAQVVADAKAKLAASERLRLEAEWDAYAFSLTAAMYRVEGEGP